MDLHSSLFFPRSFFDARPWHLLSVLEQQSHDMERQFNRMERQLHNALHGDDCSGKNDHSLTEGSSWGLQPQVVSDGNQTKYRLNIHMGKNFAPENLQVTVKDNMVSIDAKKEKKSEDGNSRFYQEVSRKFTLPTDVNIKEVKSALTPDGLLRIEAPMPQQALPEPPKVVDIPVHIV